MAPTTGTQGTGGFGFRAIVTGAAGYADITSAAAACITDTCTTVIVIIATGITVKRRSVELTQLWARADNVSSGPWR